jgi:hypothetical protein
MLCSCALVKFTFNVIIYLLTAPTLPSHAAEAALCNFFQIAFDDRELRRFIATTPSTAALVDDLPPKSCPYAEVAWGAAALLARHGLINNTLLAALRVARPNRAQELAKIRLALWRGA